MSLVSHYTSVETAINFILPTKSLKFNELRKTNDPLEYKKSIYIQLDTNMLEVYKALKVMDKLNDYFQSIKSISLTNDFTEKNKRCYFNQLMWAHYGKNHTGVCLVFDKSELIKIFKEQYSERLFDPRAVEYDDSSKKIIVSDSTDEKKIIENLSYKKKTIWNYEDEFRFIIEPQENESFIKFNCSTLKAIILGGNFPMNYLCVIKKLVSDFRIKPRLCKIIYDKEGALFLAEPEDEYLPCPKI